jgi:excinuclease ABC subunit C
VKGPAVKGLFSQGAFASFGPHGLDAERRAPELIRIAARGAKRLKARLRETCPRRPGVYGMLDARGELIYLGKAKSLRARLLSYFCPNSRDPKAGRVLEQTRALVWEYTPSEFAALLRELELIRHWRPRFNVQGQPGRRRPVYVCLGRQPAPYLFLSARPPAGVLASFGPVPRGRRSREAVRWLNDWFRLRDCPHPQEMVFADQAELFPIVRTAGCLRYEIGTCLGPCLAACSRVDYLQRAYGACAFLVGNEDAPLGDLAGSMAEAAAAQAYERAAVLRDKLDTLRWLREVLNRTRLAREQPAFFYPVAGYESEDIWYLIRGGRAVAATPVQQPRRVLALARAACRAGGQAGEPSASWDFCPADPGDADSILLVASWFRRHPEERERTLDPSAFLSACGSSARLQR